MKNLSLTKYVLQNKHLFYGTILLIFLSAVVAEFTPYLQGLIVDNTVSNSTNTLVFLCITFACVLGLDAFAKCYLNLLTTQLGYGASKEIRNNFFAKVVSQPYTFFLKEQNGELLERANSFIYAVGSFLAKNVHNLCIGIARFIIIFVFMIILNAKFALILGGLYLLVLIISLLQAKHTFNLGKKFKKAQLHRNSLILQNVENLETYLAYNDDFEYLKNYNRVNKMYGKIRKKFYISKHLINPVVDFLASLGTVIIYALAFANNIGLVEVGIVVSMLTYATRIIIPIQQITEGLAEATTANATVEQILSVMKHKEKTNYKKFDNKKVDIEIKELSFKNEIDGKNFENVSLTIPFKNKIAIIGGYGIGKTNFSELLMGLYPSNSGTITFNGINIDEISPEDLHNTITTASDTVGIFYGTIENNIRFAKPEATNEEVLTAIKKSGLEPFVASLKNGISTKISTHIISEGDKQLFAFARLILKNTPIIIIDEFTRDLDKKLEKEFLENLKEFTKDKTLIYIGQKAPTTIEFDKKIYFKKYTKK